jgi:hypothetical protein
MQLFPSEVRLRAGMRLFAVAAKPEQLELFRTDTGGLTTNVVLAQLAAAGQQVKDVASALTFHKLDGPSSAASKDAAEDADGVTAAATAGQGWFPGLSAQSSTIADHYPHNKAGAADVNVPWCFEETAVGDEDSDIFQRLGIPSTSWWLGFACTAFKNVLAVCRL